MACNLSCSFHGSYSFADEERKIIKQANNFFIRPTYFGNNSIAETYTGLFPSTGSSNHQNSKECERKECIQYVCKHRRFSPIFMSPIFVVMLEILAHIPFFRTGIATVEFRTESDVNQAMRRNKNFIGKLILGTSLITSDPRLFFSCPDKAMSFQAQSEYCCTK